MSGTLQKHLNNKFFDPVLIFAIALIAYIPNIAEKVIGGDNGDFLAAALTNGIPHPSGYPLYTMILIVFSKLPLAGVTFVWKAGLASAVISAGAVATFYLLFRELKIGRLLSIITSFTIAFSFAFWTYAEIAEVFGLNTLFIALLLWLSVRLLRTKMLADLYTLSFVAGLSLTNNLTIILLFPIISYCTLITFGKKLFIPKNLFTSIAMFFVGLLPYIYIPLAARHDPAVNWGNVVNLDNFIALITRQSYGWGNLEFDNQGVAKTVEGYLLYLQLYVSALTPVLAIAGAIQLIRKKQKHAFIVFVGSFILLGPLALIYARSKLSSLADIGILERFFLPSVVLLTALMPFGVALIQDLFSKYLKRVGGLVAQILPYIFILVPIGLYVINRPKTDFSSTTIGENLAYDLLTPLPQDSVVLFKTDSFAFNSIYVQLAKGYRKDVYIPGTYEGYGEILRAKGLNDAQIEEYQLSHQNGIDSTDLYLALPHLMEQRPVFVEEKISPTDSEKGKIVPIQYGLLWRLIFEKDLPNITKEEYLVDQKVLWESLHLEELKSDELTNSNFILADIKRHYSVNASTTANYILATYGDLDSSSKYLQLWLELDPLIINTQAPDY